MSDMAGHKNPQASEREKVAPESAERQFLWQAENRGLTLPWYDEKEPHYIFDLNKGEIATQPNLESVWEVVKLARDAARSDSHGEHNVLLDMVAERSAVDAGSDHIYFHRPYYEADDQAPENWVSLKEILENAGYDMQEIYRESA